jgi:hypothetical protein
MVVKLKKLKRFLTTYPKIVIMKNFITFKSLLKSIHYSWVIFMLSAIASLFSGSAQASKKDQVYPRQINLSGNIFHFSLPEDFSTDMPAADMVERLNITDLKKFDDPKYGNLIRRWWDLKEPGWFGKKLGTVMMDISVQRVAENKAKIFHSNPYDVTDRMDFILMLDDVYHQRYDALNKTMQPDAGNQTAYNSGFVTVSGRKIFSLHQDTVFNSQKWVKHFIAGPDGATIVVFATPLDMNTYLYVNFTYSANNNVLPRELSAVADEKFSIVYKSFNIQYKNENPLKDVVGKKWLENTNQEILERHRQSVLKLFYGNDPEKALLEQEKELRESQIKDEAELRKTLKHDPL